MNEFTPEIKHVHCVRTRDGSKIIFYNVDGHRKCFIRQSKKLRQYLDGKIAEAVKGHKK